MQPGVQPQGKAIGYKPLAEEWNFYSIDDGYVIGIKVVLTKLLKTEHKDPSGVPVYGVAVSSPIMQVLTQEEYRSITSRSQIPK